MSVTRPLAAATVPRMMLTMYDLPLNLLLESIGAALHPYRHPVAPETDPRLSVRDSAWPFTLYVAS